MSNPDPSSSPLHPEWRAFLEQQGANIEADCVRDFGQPEVERRLAKTDTVLTDLSHLALLHASGPDAGAFLQGQLSNDIRQVSATQSQLSAYCNPKGRMLAIFLVLQRPEDGYYLQLPAALAEATLKRLRMFILRAKVNLAPADLGLARIGLSGPNADSMLRDLLGLVPANPYDSITSGDVTVIRLAGPHPRFELLAPWTQLVPLWKAITGQARPVGAAPWSWLDITAGIPVVLPGTVEEFVPQMANLELVGGVSFNKGCYPGQEIVARMHYLGRLKQRMFRAHVEGVLPPPPGTPVFAPDLPGQSTGTIVDAQLSPEGGCDLLVVVHLSSKETGELHLASSDGPRLVVMDTPYLLEPAASTSST